MQVRPPRARPLTLGALALLIGLVAGLAGLASSLVAAAAIGVGAALAALSRSSRELAVFAALALVAAGGAVMGWGARRGAEADCRLLWESGAEVRLTVRALGYLPAGEGGITRLRPLRAPERLPPGSCAWSGTVRAYASGPIRPGHVYELTGAWRPVNRPGRGPRSPEGTGWIVAARATPLSAPSFTSHPLLRLRGELAERLWGLYPRRWAPLALALVLGQRETVEPEVSRRMGRAGLAHLLAISGFHVGLLAAALFAIARTVRLSSSSAHLVVVTLTVLYVLLIGAPASAVRAGLMIALWSLTRLAGRASSPFDVLGLAAILLLLARPWSVSEPGFQLSFAGAAAVGWAHREVGRWMWLRGRSAAMRGVAASAFASVAAVLLTAPISAAYFGRVAPGAVVGNLIAVPLLALAMPALFLSALCFAAPALAGWFASAAVATLWGIDRVARFLSQTSWASFEVAPPSLAAAIVYVVVLVLSAHALHGAWYRRRLFLVVGLVWSGAIAGPVLHLPLGGDGVEVYVLDVGQGDAIAIRTPGRRWLLVDAGPNIQGFDAGRSRVVPFLRDQGVGRLEAWLASHPDLDHVGGGPAVLESIDVERVVGIGLLTGQLGQLEVLRELVADEAVWLAGRAGGRIEIDGVSLTFLHPAERTFAVETIEPNALSLVFRLEFGAFRMLFTGDLPGEEENRLAIERPEALRAHVLKVSHHGSASSSTPRFLAAVQPQLAVISAGRGNRYGHPSPLVLARLLASRIEVHRTDHEGTLVISAAADGSWRLRSAALAGW